jgi:hypothetical protein
MVSGCEWTTLQAARTKAAGISMKRNVLAHKGGQEWKEEI